MVGWKFVLEYEHEHGMRRMDSSKDALCGVFFSFSPYRLSSTRADRLYILPNTRASRHHSDQRVWIFHVKRPVLRRRRRHHPSPNQLPDRNRLTEICVPVSLVINFHRAEISPTPFRSGRQCRWRRCRSRLFLLPRATRRRCAAGDVAALPNSDVVCPALDAVQSDVDHGDIRRDLDEADEPTVGVFCVMIMRL